MTRRQTVGISYRFLPHYRTGFFSALRTALCGDGIDLELCYGVDAGADLTPAATLEWARPVRNKTISLGSGPPLVWQRLTPEVRAADLVVLMQESRMLSNYPVIVRGMAHRARVALWGHGLNFEQAHGSRSNRFKLFYSRQVHWWFAYTQGVADVLADAGFPKKQITVVENSIDTDALRAAARALASEPKEALERRLGLAPGPTAVFCGRLYERKRVDFLLDASIRIRARIPGFQLIIIGEGEDELKVRAFAQGNPWVHYVGALFHADIVPYFRASDVCLMPGAVGLTLLDAFALETPLVTTRLHDHGPEIEYLRQERNGLMTENTLEAYVDGAVRVLSSPALLEAMRRGCRESADHYTLQNMVHNFRQGVHGALAPAS
jgi:glycosyltransferase involved in cell wall biosynthesis